jgi:type VI secretion system secreted protein VgrG
MRAYLRLFSLTTWILNGQLTGSVANAVSPAFSKEQGVAEFDPISEGITGRQAYFLDVPGTGSAAQLSVVSFDASEKMGEPNTVRIVVTHPGQLARADYLSRDAVFRIVSDEGMPKMFSGYIERVSTIH